jgi:hypothetical protein
MSGNHRWPVVLFISRGKGRGHALPDLAISNLLREKNCVEVKLASYGTGYRTLRDNGEIAAVDLGMPDDNSFLESIILCTRLVRDVSPDLIVAHEEFAAVVAASTYQIPALFIIDWFIDPLHIWMQTLNYAREVIFIDDPGIFTEPPNIRNKVFYAGPLIRPLKYHSEDRYKARGELGIANEEIVVSCLPGTTYEVSSPIIDLVLGAYDQLEYPNKRLIWIDETRRSALLDRCGSREDVYIKGQDWLLERIMVASDVVINKGTRNILRELYEVNTPSVSISHGQNWLDDVIANRISTNIPLNAATTKPSDLAEHLRSLIEKGPPHNTAVKRDSSTRGLEKTVERILNAVASS